jgi:hypothetical protein
MKLDNSEKETLISFLKEDTSDQLNWTQKKEVTAWTAAALYLFILTTTLTALHDVNLGFFGYCGLIFIMLCIGSSIVLFVFSNYNSIYNSSAYYLAMKKQIFNLMENSSEFDKQSLKYPENKWQPKFIQKEINSALESIRPYENINRVYNTVYDFWMAIIQGKAKKAEDQGWSNYAIQESMIYSLILLVFILFTLFV